MTKNSSKLSKNAVKSKNKKLNWKFKKCAKVGFGLVKRVKFQNFHKNEKKRKIMENKIILSKIGEKFVKIHAKPVVSWNSTWILHE